MVACEIVHFYAQVGQFADFSQEAGIAFGYGVFVFVPEIKNVAQQINGSSLVLDAVEKVDEASFLHSSVGYGPAAQMGV